MGFVFFLFFVIPIVVVVIVMAHKYNEETKENWRRAAHLLKLKYNPGNFVTPHRISGKINRQLIDVSTFTRKSGDNSNTYTQYRVTYNKMMPTKFKLTKQNMLHGLGKVFGMQDIELRDPAFDDSVLVQGENPAAIARFLTAPRRKHIKKAILMFPEIEITERSITVTVSGRDRIPSSIISRVKFLCSLCHAIEKDYDDEHPITQVKKLRKDGEVKKAIEVVETAELSDEDEKLEAKEQEAELRYIANEKEKAAEIFGDIKKEISADVSSSQWKRHAETTAEPEVDTTEYEPDEEKIEKLACDHVCKELFEAGSSITFDITKKFEQDYKDKMIEWEGKIERVSKFSFDYVFKDCKGVKVNVFVHKITNGSFGDPKVHAIVHFPMELYDSLKKAEKKKIKFTGKMVGVDSLMHNIYIGDGHNVSNG